MVKALQLFSKFMDKHACAKHWNVNPSSFRVTILLQKILLRLRNQIVQDLDYRVYKDLEKYILCIYHYIYNWKCCILRIGHWHMGYLESGMYAGMGIYNCIYVYDTCIIDNTSHRITPWYILCYTKGKGRMKTVNILH